MKCIHTRIQNLKKEIDELEELLKYPHIEIGKIYLKEDTECLYSFIDWNGEVRLLNITNSHMWKPTLKSRLYRMPGEQKVKFIPYHAALETWKAGIEKFSLKEN